MKRILIELSDQDYDYFKKFKLTNIGDGVHIDNVTNAIKNGKVISDDFYKEISKFKPNFKSGSILY